MRYHGFSQTILALLALSQAFAQKPIISSGGVVNAASLVPVGMLGHALGPGSLATIFGQNLAVETVTGSPPYSTMLGGTSVTIGGVAAPLLYVSPRQINFQLPMPTTALGYGSRIGYTRAPVIVTSRAGASEPLSVDLYDYGPGIFTLDGSGCGRGAVLNVKADGTVSLNSPTDSASPGDFLEIFATGLGMPYASIPDGYPSPPGPYLGIGQAGGAGFDGVGVIGTYVGRAPGLVGVDQVNVQISDSVRDGCNVPMATGALFLSTQQVLVSIRRGGGACVDPPQQSFGQIDLQRTVFMNSALPEINTLTALFESSPGRLAPKPMPLPSSTGRCSSYSITSPQVSACSIPGYSFLSPGTLTVDGPSLSPVQAKPSSVDGKTVYIATLPAGAIRNGTFNVMASADGGTGPFQTSLAVGSGIQITSQFPTGTDLRSDLPVTLNWTGGDPDTIVTMRLVSHYFPVDFIGTCAVSASNHTLTWSPGIPPRKDTPLAGLGDMDIIVGVEPAAPSTFSAPGLTLGGRQTWRYEYRFTGLHYR